MAFQAPQRQQQQRPQPISTVHVNAATDSVQRQLENALPEEPQEWILFSPDNDYTDTQTTTASISNRTARTGKAATAQLSDLGSFDTGAVSSEFVVGQIESIQDQNDEDDDDEDLDSLDDGLHAFNEPFSPAQQHHRIIEQGAETVLPAHDGLGKFPGNSSLVQEQFWEHEQYNPRRRRLSHRRTSLHKRAPRTSLEDDLAAIEEQEQKLTEEDKIQRIEKWRMEQGKAVLEEVEREARRIRRRHQHRRTASSSHISHSFVSEPQTVPETTATNREEESPALYPPTNSESFWQRFTRKVIRDLMGFDDRTLSFIFGKSVMPDQSPATGAVEQAGHEQQDLTLARTESWEDRLLARIAKELGTLLNHISEHPGAFSTFLRTQEPFPYAGISSSVPRSNNSPQPPSTTHFAPTLPNTAMRFQHHRRTSTSSTADASLWGIEEEPSSPKDQTQSRDRERQYWEKELDVQMVFKFLRSRISSPFSSSSTTSQAPTPLNPLYHPNTNSNNHNSTYHSSPLTPNISSQSNTGSNVSSSPLAPAPARLHHPHQADTLRRAALIRQHHPLVSRTNPSHSNSSAVASASLGTAKGTVPSVKIPTGANGAVAITPTASPLLSPVLGRRPSEGSCASQSTKRSKTARSGSISSRNYWDIGGSGSDRGGALGFSSAWGAGWGEV